MNKPRLCLVCGEPLKDTQEKFCSVVCEDTAAGHPYPGHETWEDEQWEEDEEED